MLTRRVARVCGVREAALSLPLLGPLPGDLVKLILRLLPLDERLRAREVRRGWCALLEDAGLWMDINLSKSCRVNPRLLNPCYGEERVINSLYALALLRAASVRAKGNLQSLDLSGVGYIAGKPFVLRWLDSASAADKASLRDLVAPPHSLCAEQVTAVCRALPLCRVRCTVCCTAVEALPLLRRVPPFALLTIGNLFVRHNPGVEQAVRDLASALSVYKGIDKLGLSASLASRAVVDALVDAVISAGIKDMVFCACGLSQTALPALTRLLQSPGFERLQVDNYRRTLFEGPTLPAFCEALRNSTSLKTLKLSEVNLWADVATATQLIAALEGLPALQELALYGNHTDGTPAVQRVAGECLARLIARSTSLRVLSLSNNELGETGLAPIFDALRNNSSLTELVFGGELISPKFARKVVMPAVRANTHLRRLEGLSTVGLEELGEERDPSLREVEGILEARRQADKNAA